MAYFLFIDESGQDHRLSPYEVLAGIVVEDKDLWNLIVEKSPMDVSFGCKSRRDEMFIDMSRVYYHPAYLWATEHFAPIGAWA